MDHLKDYFLFTKQEEEKKTTAKIYTEKNKDKDIDYLTVV